MNDEELIELLRKIKEHCKEKDNCNECKFKLHNADCISSECFITRMVDYIPQDWDIAEIERIIKA